MPFLDLDPIALTDLAPEDDDETGDQVGGHALKAQADADADGAGEYKQEAEVHPHRVEGDQQPHPEEDQPDDGVDRIARALLDAEGRVDLVVQVGLQQAGRIDEKEKDQEGLDHDPDGDAGLADLDHRE